MGGTYAVAGQACVSVTSTIYCVGGIDANGGPRNEVYYAMPSSSGNVTNWNLESAAYPQFINGQSCVASSGYIYCVGGTYNDAGDDTTASYFAAATGGALGNWSTTTPYPVPVDTQSCMAAASYIYCVGGNNETDGSNADSTLTNSVWYAPISSTGIGTWKLTTAYPTSVVLPVCYAAGGYAYCLGGADVNGNSVVSDYFAPLRASGVGSWTATTPYPVAASGQACVVSSGIIVCVGGETAGGQTPSYTSAVYSASVSSGGIGSWKKGTSYPLSIGTTCAGVSGNVYCVGGFDQSSVQLDSYVEYASVSSLTA